MKKLQICHFLSRMFKLYNSLPSFYFSVEYGHHVASCRSVLAIKFYINIQSHLIYLETLEQVHIGSILIFVLS